jgi:hypothetical protein
MLKPIITTSAVKDLIVKIDNYSGKLEYMKNDTAIKTIVDSLKVLIQ